MSNNSYLGCFSSDESLVRKYIDNPRNTTTSKLGNKLFYLSVKSNSNSENSNFFGYSIFFEKDPISIFKCEEEIRNYADDSDFKVLNNTGGEFSFGVVNNNGLGLFRDHFGIIPLYYWKYKDNIFFSNSISKIVELDIFTKKVNKKKVVDFLCHTETSQEITFFEGIFRVPPGSYMNFDGSNVNIHKYLKIEMLTSKDDLETSAQKFKKIFSDVLKSQIDHRATLTLLSGGLDSSTITKLIDTLQNDSNHVESLSVVFANLTKEEFAVVDESTYIKLMQENLNLKTNDLLIDANSISFDPEEYFEYFVEPIVKSNLFFYENIYSFCKKNDGKVLIEGIDGDSVISHGYERIVSLARNYNFVELYKEFKALNKSLNRSQNTILSTFKAVIKVNLPVKLKNFFRELFGFMYPFQYNNTFLPRNIKKSKNQLKKDNKDIYRIEQGEFLDEFETHYHQAVDNRWESIFEMSYVISQKYNIETRYPFFDIRLVKYCLNLPSSYKLNNGITRLILRESMKNILPEGVRNRFSKSNIGPIIDKKIVVYDLNELKAIFCKDSPIYGLYDEKVAKQRFLSGSIQNKDKDMLFKYIQLFYWMKSLNLTWNQGLREIKI